MQTNNPASKDKIKSEALTSDRNSTSGIYPAISKTFEAIATVAPDIYRAMQTGNPVSLAISTAL